MTDHNRDQQNVNKQDQNRDQQNRGQQAPGQKNQGQPPGREQRSTASPDKPEGDRFDQEHRDQTRGTEGQSR